MESVYILDAARTPIGKFLGQYKNIEASKLGGATIKYLLKKNKILPEMIDELVVGQVLTAGVGMNPARQAGIFGELEQKTPCYLVNQVCGSGLRSVIEGAKSILLQDAKIVIAGGQENMSRARHTILARISKKIGDLQLYDSLYQDGLIDYFCQYPMGQTAENVAKKHKINREQQDEFAYFSQKKTKKALQENAFQKQTLPQDFLIELCKQQTSFREEHPRDVKLQDLANLKPVFQKDGTVTAGNASGINDGAAFMVLANEQALKQLKIDPVARILGWFHSGVDPKYMGIGPVSATQGLMQKINEKIENFDLIESNEAFAVTSIAVNKLLKLDIEKVNINGGAIALGHPIGASGTRILTDLIYALKQKKLKKGLATMCIGGGMGISLAVERC